MTEHIQALLVIAGLVSAIVGGPLVALIAALCWFLKNMAGLLKKLLEETLPGIIAGFHEDLADEREECHRNHEIALTRMDERHAITLKRMDDHHAELMTEIRRVRQ